MPAIPVVAAEDIIRAGRRMDQRGWVPATAGNISVRIKGPRIAITRSGGHKGFLDSFSVIEVDLEGTPAARNVKPSAETLLHCQLYRAFPEVNAVLHGHSVANTVLSLETQAPALSFSGYEVQKIFAGQTTHEATLHLPVFANDQDIARLAAAIEPHLATATMGYLIRGHGAYVWGPDMDTALARLEGLEFLLACALERRRP
jgi:methylthioribulose-1-phosphate dehydratase